jgi:hypothetical protein
MNRKFRKTNIFNDFVQFLRLIHAELIFRRCCYDIVEEARGRTRKNMEEKRRRLRKEASSKGQDPFKVVVSFVFFYFIVSTSDFKQMKAQSTYIFQVYTKDFFGIGDANWRKDSQFRLYSIFNCTVPCPHLVFPV